jgi:hypothetical protein
MAYRIPILAPHLEHVARVTRNKSTLVQRATETDGPLPIRVNPAKTLIDVSPMREAIQCSRILRFSSDAGEAQDTAAPCNIFDMIQQLACHALPSTSRIDDNTLYIAFAPSPLDLSKSHALAAIIDANRQRIAIVCKKLPKNTHIPRAENIKFMSHSDNEIFIIKLGRSYHG